MRKFGVRALACSLAAALVMTGLATPSVAKAEDILLIAPAPESVKTLYITADMVDCDGEIVISGESWDRIVVSKEAESKDIYFDQVNVKELVVESGSSSNIQLWEVKADTVTVKEPELSELSVKELSSLLADPATQHMAVDLFMKNMEKNAKTEKKAPSIVTMEDAQIGEVVAHGNVTLDLAQGEVENLVVKASEKQQRVNVTVKNYDGSVSYKGGDALNITTLKLVDSRVKALKVDESAANNYLNVNNKDSVAMKVEVAGNAQVSLNVPMGELAVTEAATAAQVSVLNAVDELNISANAAQIDVSPIANIASATVEGDDVKVTGSGYLAEVDITGKGAYVSTEGTKVEGENTYVKQEYVPPQVVITDIDLVGGGGAVVTKNSNGSSTVVYKPSYQTASFMVPANVDKDRISSVVVELTYNGQFCVKFGGTSKADEYPGWGTTEATDGTMTYSINCATEKLARLDFMCLQDALELTIKKITFNLLDEAPEAEPTPIPTPEPQVPGSYTFGQIKEEAFWNGSSSVDETSGKNTMSFTAQYAQAFFAIPEDVDVTLLESITLNGLTGSDYGIKLMTQEEMDAGSGNAAIVDYGKPTLATGGATDIKYFVVMSTAIATAEAPNVISVNSVSFNLKEKVEEEETPVEGYTFAEIKEIMFWDGSSSVDAKGKNTMAFNKQYAQAFFAIPEDVDVTLLESVTLNGLTGSDYGIKLMTQEEMDAGSGNAAIVDYGKPTITTNGATNIKYFVVMSTANAENTVSVQSVIFTLKEASEEVKDSVVITEPENTVLSLNDSLTLVAEATGDIAWSSSDEAIATVVDGKVIPAGKGGKVTITATCGSAKDEVEVTVEKVFYLARNIKFENVAVADDGGNNVTTIGDDIYLNPYEGTNNFVKALPEVLKNNAEVAEKFTTLAGIMEVVDSFEYQYVLTESTVVDGGNEAYEPQSQSVVQGSGWKNGIYKWNGLGANAEGIKMGTTIISTSDFAGWDDDTLAKVAVQIVKAKAGTKLSGEYTIKVNLK